MKFTTGSPKPDVREPGARDREGGRRIREVDRFGMMRAGGRVSMTVSAALPTRLKVAAPHLLPDLGLDRAHRQPGQVRRERGRLRRVGHRQVVLGERRRPRLREQRAAAHEVHHRQAEPEFANPLPLIVKLAGGLARSIALGVMPLTPGDGPRIDDREA